MRRPQVWLVGSIGAAIIALMLLAISLPQLSLAPGHVFNLSLNSSTQVPAPASASNNVDLWSTVLSVIILAALVLMVIGFIFSAQFRREFLKRLFTVIGILLVLYLVVNALNHLQAPATTDFAPSTATTQPTATTSPREPLPAFDPNPPTWLTAVISLGLLALVMGTIWRFWKRAQVPENPFVALAQATLNDLQAGGDLRDAVMRCYIEMGRVLSQERGIERSQTMTTREFEQHLAAAGLRDEHVLRLSRLFERVRYGAGHASAQDEQEATACLSAIVQAYGRAS